MKKIRSLAIFNSLGLLLHIVISGLTQFRLINNKTVGEISDQHTTLFTPSSTTFLIWEVIYVSLIAFCIYHLVIAHKHDETHDANRDLRKIGFLFLINNLAAAAWLIVWVNNAVPVSVVLILVQLICLIIIHRRLNIHDASRSLQSKVFTQFPLSIYFGWITIAAIANVGSWLSFADWNGWGISATNWTITLIALIILLTVNIINRRKNVFFGLVILWALYGIIEKRMSVDPDASKPIVMIAWVAIAAIGLACLFGFIRNLRRR